ncbi:MAG: NifU family protein [Myxococcota bacterium]
MIAVTELALSKIRDVIQSESGVGNLIRVNARRVAPYRFDYDIHFIEPEEINDDDTQEKIGELVFVVDPASAANLEGATIDFVVGPPEGFKFDNPRAKRSFYDPLEAELNDFIEDEINPKIAAHRGHILLHGIENRVVYVEMGGGCQGCGMAAMTLRQGVEKRIRERFPDLLEILDVTKHDEGTHPFYEPRS